jgi:2,3-dihydroxybenzoate decarboxylase
VKIGASEKLPRLPSEYFLENFVITTSGVTSGPALRLALDMLGADRILFAADYPYEIVADAVSFLDGAAITEAERAKIYSQNAVRVFRLD